MVNVEGNTELVVTSELVTVFSLVVVGIISNIGRVLAVDNGATVVIGGGIESVLSLVVIVVDGVDDLTIGANSI